MEEQNTKIKVFEKTRIYELYLDKAEYSLLIKSSKDNIEFRVDCIEDISTKFYTNKYTLKKIIKELDLPGTNINSFEFIFKFIDAAVKKKAINLIKKDDQIVVHTERESDFVLIKSNLSLAATKMDMKESQVLLDYIINFSKKNGVDNDISKVYYKKVKFFFDNKKEMKKLEQDNTKLKTENVNLYKKVKLYEDKLQERANISDEYLKYKKDYTELNKKYNEALKLIDKLKANNNNNNGNKSKENNYEEINEKIKQKEMEFIQEKQYIKLELLDVIENFDVNKLEEIINHISNPDYRFCNDQNQEEFIEQNINTYNKNSNDNYKSNGNSNKYNTNTSIKCNNCRRPITKNAFRNKNIKNIFLCETCVSKSRAIRKNYEKFDLNKLSLNNEDENEEEQQQEEEVNNEEENEENENEVKIDNEKYLKFNGVLNKIFFTNNGKVKTVKITDEEVNKVVEYMKLMISLGVDGYKSLSDYNKNVIENKLNDRSISDYDKNVLKYKRDYIIDIINSKNLNEDEANTNDNNYDNNNNNQLHGKSNLNVAPAPSENRRQSSKKVNRNDDCNIF